MNLLDERSKAWVLKGEETNDVVEPSSSDLKSKETKSRAKSPFRAVSSTNKKKGGKNEGGGGGGGGAKGGKKSKKTAEEEDGKN